MNALAKHLNIQFKVDVREKGTLLTFYVIPLLFFIVMGAVFSSINPTTKETLAASLSIFGTTMGAVIGIPVSLVKLRESGVLRAYLVNGIPSSIVLIIQALSAFLHLLLVSIIILISAKLLFGAGFPKSFTMYFMILCIYLFTSISLGLFLGVISNSQPMATMLSQAIFLPSQMLSGIMFPSSMLPKPFVWIGRIFPATHAMQSFSGLAFGLKTDYSAALALSITALIGIIAALITFLLFIAKEKEL